MTLIISQFPRLYTFHEHPLFGYRHEYFPGRITPPLPPPKGTWKTCGVCKEVSNGTPYSKCHNCDFWIHSDCGGIGPNTFEIATEGGDKLIHEHPMQFLQYIPRGRSFPCSECGGSCIYRDVYGCIRCCYFIHPGCRPVQTGGVVQHDWCHPCDLIGYMVHKRNKNNDQSTLVSCNVCGRRGERGSVIFHCSKCNFNIHSECINISPATPSNIKVVSDSTEYYCHEHPLTLYNLNIPTDRVECSVCGKYCSNSAYGCLPCAFFLHPSCAELKLPQKIYHPFHLYHPLFLLEHRGSPAKCNACRKDTRAIAYICKHDNCSFSLDIICGEVRLPAIEYEAHSHLLHFRERTDHDKLKCNACDKTCESSIFSCLYCDWNLHYTCGPLPISITYKYDEDSLEDSLVVTNALAEHEDEMDDEFYCDVCEKQRDPLLPTYQCTDHCNFVAEVGCVISEVISLLRGDRGDHVELRDPFGQHGKLIMPPKNTIEDQMKQNKEDQSEPTLRLSKILKSLNEDESKELTRVLEARKIRETFSAEERFFNDPEKDNVLRFSDKDYTQFIKFLDRGIEISIDQLRDGSGSEVLFRSLDQKPPYVYFALEEEVVNVGDHYKAARTFAHILRQLISKHGDISAASTLSPNVKLFFLNMLCGCIYSMRNTKVVDITTDLLLIWWTILRTCQVAGFEVQSVFDHLKRVADAFFGLYVGKQADKVERDLAELKRKHDCIAFSTKRDLVDECLREASVLKQGKAITERLWELI
ncbi:hypothetical protein F2P56_031031 [Juglans regia]|uniref:Zinc finger PHD-type domain-containing protein n=2 Tax=Juglans regia TaxID=51240 RepID=A0A833U302_JUGRE|nr:uncharacterized protein LOC108988348 [Juglans regia]KAF5450702.1 hypothetical protein F2P56_031031 [Juglans regia]